MQSWKVPGQRRESGSLRHLSLRDPSQGIPPAGRYKFAKGNRVTNTEVAGDGDYAYRAPTFVVIAIIYIQRLQIYKNLLISALVAVRCVVCAESWGMSGTVAPAMW